MMLAGLVRGGWRVAVCSVMALSLPSHARAQAVVDTAFNVTPNGFVSTLAIQPDGKILLGGNFTTVNGAPRPYLARVEANGTLDASFAPTNGPAEFVSRIVVRDGKIYVAAGDGLRRFDFTGALDWLYPLSVAAFDVDSQQRVVMGGQFIRIEGQYHRNLARLTAAGNVDAAFSPAVGCCAGEGVNAVLAQGESVIAGGLFQSVNGSVVSHLARINSDGSTDSAFQGSANPPVLALAATSDGKILRASEQTLARHLGDGSPDPAFTAVSAGGSSDDRFVAIAPGPGGSVVAGGSFSLDGGSTRSYVARFNNDGSVDSSFSIEPNNTVQALAVQADGSVVIGGHFTTVNGVARAGIARVSATPPPLRIAPAGAGQVVLSWRTATGFFLESRGLGDGAWSIVGGPAVTANGRTCVTNACATDGRIYRLRSNP